MHTLTADERARVASVWIARAESEARAIHAFAAIGADLVALDAPSALREIAARAVGEEADHARRCALLASSYAGRPLAVPAARAGLPTFARAPERLRPVLRVLVACALQETVSSSFIARCRERATAPPVRELLRVLLADEVDHARLGWAVLALPSLGDEIRGLVGGLLPDLVGILARTWADPPDVPPALAGHGCLPRAEVHEVVRGALRDLVLPGFAALGVDTAPARRRVDDLTWPR